MIERSSQGSALASIRWGEECLDYFVVFGSRACAPKSCVEGSRPSSSHAGRCINAFSGKERVGGVRDG